MRPIDRSFALLSRSDSRPESARARFAGTVRALVADCQANVLIIAALALPVFLGVLGIAIEGANWFQVRQKMQNAADAAAVAAATNGKSNYATEALAVAAQLGFRNGNDNVVVTASNTAACPTGPAKCYSVTISKPVPLMFSQLVGFRGSTRIGGTGAFAQTIMSSAVARQGSEPRNYCVVALAGSGTTPALRSNGAPKADLSGCSTMSNTDATCNGHNLGATFGDAYGTNNGCGQTETSNVPAVSDPYAALASNIPSDPCSSYPQKPAKKKDPALPSSNLLSGTISSTGNRTFCGDVQLTGDVTLTGAALVMVIENGELDTNGFTIRTASGAAATIVFSGSNTGGYLHTPSGGGTIDIAAPTSGPWSGVAIYQDPVLTSGVDISAAGNSPTWNITGLVYLPNSSVTFSGAVNKSSNGQSCFVMVVDNLLINGTGSILSTGGCAAAGLTMPQSKLPARGALVS